MISMYFFRCISLSLILCFPAVALSQNEIIFSKHFSIEKLSDGIYAAIHNDDGGEAICNAGIVDLGNKTIIIDPFLTPAAAKDLRILAESLTGRQASFVINTHYHNDHTRGNQVFKPEAQIIATSFTRTKLLETFDAEIASERRMTPAFLKRIEEAIPEARGQELRELKMWKGYYKGKIKSFDDLKLTTPDITIDDSLTIHGSTRSLKIICTGEGHTESDLIILIPEEKIAFMGDQLFRERHPFLGAGNPANWVKNLELIERNYTPEILVPGHGPVGSPETIHELTNYIHALNEIITSGLESQKTESAILATSIPAQYKDWLLSTFYPINLKVLYDLQKKSQ